ncbi:hypothetical protein F4679DRAFT_583258 [Xylaria curta]|nr:hypothetical protein F4679DRAFT_583258 [Xylaria curta]
MSSSTGDQLRYSRPLVKYAGEEKNFAIWDANREILRRLFLTENCSLKIVKQRMEVEHGFPTFPLIDYETTLRDHFHFRKNLKASDWCSIGYHVEKRRLQGKPSSVYLEGTLQEPRKVKKEIQRYTKRSVLQRQIRMNHVPSLLRQNILIRTPSPEPQRNAGTMIRSPLAVDITVLCQRIDDLRLQSPSTKFISSLMTQMMPNTPMEETIEIARRISVSTIEISPSLNETSDLALLSQSCFLLSNNADNRNFEPNIAKPLLNWIGISAELHVLKGFFSIESSTIQSVWDSLYVSSIRLRKPQAYSVIVEVGLSINEGRWVTRRTSCLVDAVNMGAKNRVADLVERYGIDPNLAVSNDQVPDIRVPSRVGYDMITPLTLAAYECDLDIIEILLKHGATIDPPFAQDEESSILPPLFAALQFGNYYDGALRPSFDSIKHCVCALLDAGSNVDIHVNGRRTTQSNPWGWVAPGQASWLVDYAWMIFHDDMSLLTKLSERSVKMECEITVAGICLAAKQGHGHFRRYLDNRPFPKGKDRTAILQIAISQAAAYGISECVGDLLQLGVDPNVQYIEDDLESRSDDESWHPVVRAAQGCHYNVLGLLGNINSWSRPLSILEKLFCTDRVANSFYWDYKTGNSHRTGDSGLSMTTALSLVEFSRPGIEKDGRGLILLFLRRAYKENFATCAQVCDMAWSWGAPRMIGDNGRDALHYAIFHNCCLDMVKFLIARGYQVHSKFAYDYGYHSLNLPLATEIEGPSSPCRSSMLGDALSSFANDRVAIVNFLLENGANTENTREHYTLLESVCFRDPGCPEYRDETVKIFKTLFYHNASVNRPLHQAPRVSLLSSLLYYEANDSLIFQVIDATRDIDEHVEGYTPLLTAITVGRLAIAKRLLDRGAKVDHPIYTDYRSPLSIACERASEDIPMEFIKDLLRRGAAINPPKAAALHFAASAGKLNIAALLLKHGADVNASHSIFDDLYVLTPLDSAAMQGRLDMVHLLRGMGGKSGFQGKTGVDGAISHARYSGHYAVAEFLCSEFTDVVLDTLSHERVAGPYFRFY